MTDYALHDRFVVLRERVRIIRDRAQNEVSFLLEEKTRGNLTKEAGESALYHQEQFLSSLNDALEGSE